MKHNHSLIECVEVKLETFVFVQAKHAQIHVFFLIFTLFFECLKSKSNANENHHVYAIHIRTEGKLVKVSINFMKAAMQNSAMPLQSTSMLH